VGEEMVRFFLKMEKSISPALETGTIPWPHFLWGEPAVQNLAIADSKKNSARGYTAHNYLLISPALQRGVFDLVTPPPIP
jgi:hypothetical protein